MFYACVPIGSLEDYSQCKIKYSHLEIQSKEYEKDNYVYIHMYYITTLYVLVLSQYKCIILVITQVRGEAEDEG